MSKIWQKTQLTDALQRCIGGFSELSDLDETSNRD